jgi:hypothetical protein
VITSKVYRLLGTSTAQTNRQNTTERTRHANGFDISIQQDRKETSTLFTYLRSKRDDNFCQQVLLHTEQTVETSNVIEGWNADAERKLQSSITQAF